MYTTIIFDFFDVIRNDPYKAWLDKHGIQRTGTYAEASKPLDRGEITSTQFFEVLETLSGHSAASVAQEYAQVVAMDPGTVPLLQSLSENYKLGLLSNASSDYLRPILEKHDYERLFDVVVISGETGLIKPSPEAFWDVLSKLSAHPEETIFIDDAHHNIAAANKLGITGVLYSSLPQLKVDLAALGVSI